MSKSVAITIILSIAFCMGAAGYGCEQFESTRKARIEKGHVELSYGTWVPKECFEKV